MFEGTCSYVLSSKDRDRTSTSSSSRLMISPRPKLLLVAVRHGDADRLVAARITLLEHDSLGADALRAGVCGSMQSCYPGQGLEAMITDWPPSLHCGNFATNANFCCGCGRK